MHHYFILANIDNFQRENVIANKDDASHGIIINIVWIRTPAIDLQATDRAHIIGYRILFMKK